MKYFHLLPETGVAGHCTVGGSNKVWAACVAYEQAEGQTLTPATSAHVYYLCVYGPAGGRLRVEPPQRLLLDQAQALVHTKWREKQRKGYQPIAFASLAPAFVYPDGASLILPDYSDEAHREQAASPSRETTFRFSATPVKALSWEQLQEQLSVPVSGFSEKVNGERCLLEFDGQHLVAYNRRGQPVNTPPQGALSLARLQVPFVLDGERMPGIPAERFVAFDLLEWQGEDLREHPYHARLAWLTERLSQAGLLATSQPTPTLQEALANSLVPDLALLTTTHSAEEKARLLNTLQQSGSEGVIVRRLTAPYQEAPGKFKFQADLDAFVYAIQAGRAGGSLKLGLVRPGDQAVIAIGQVRAGLTTEDLSTVQRLLDQGCLPVFTVHYLPARTIGLHLVEPHTSLRLLRTDKEARECTTEQLGPEKTPLLAQAQPIPGISLS